MSVWYQSLKYHKNPLFFSSYFTLISFNPEFTFTKTHIFKSSNFEQILLNTVQRFNPSSPETFVFELKIICRNKFWQSQIRFPLTPKVHRQHWWCLKHTLFISPWQNAQQCLVCKLCVYDPCDKGAKVTRKQGRSNADVDNPFQSFSIPTVICRLLKPNLEFLEVCCQYGTTVKGF